MIIFFAHVLNMQQDGADLGAHDKDNREHLEIQSNSTETVIKIESEHREKKTISKVYCCKTVL
jgi:hypothetical protein